MVNNNSLKTNVYDGITLGNDVAASSINKKNRPIQKGETAFRLKLMNEEDSRFNIAIKVIDESSKCDRLIGSIGATFGFYIKVKDTKNRVLFLKTESVTSRLHLTPKQAKSMGSITALKERAAEVSTVFLAHKKIIEDANKSGKVSEEVSLNLLHTLKAIDSSSSKKIRVNEKDYLIIPKEKVNSTSQKVDIYAVDKFLGKGEFGNVYALCNLTDSTSEKMVIKLAKKDRVAQEDVKNEYDILKEHQHIGIQFSPHKFIYLSSEENEEQQGYLGVKYDGDYLTELKTSAPVSDQQKLFDVYQLLSGLQYLHKNNVAHSDLRAENIFVKGSGYDKLVHIADFGGSKEIDSSTLEQLKNMTFTPNTYP